MATLTRAPLFLTLYGFAVILCVNGQKEETTTLKAVTCSTSQYYVQPHPKFCNKFTMCSNGNVQEFTCGLGSMFNPLALVCDFPDNVDCKSRLIDFDTYDCQKEDMYKASHPWSCDKFIECDKGSLHIKTCPPSTAFDYETNECDYRYKAKCKKPISLEHDSNDRPPLVRPRRALRTIRIRNANNLNLDCTFDYISPHPHYCNKFVECENNRLFVKDCGPGTAYNPQLGQCDWPYNVRQVHPTECRKYLQCGSYGRYDERTCPSFHAFDSNRGICSASTDVTRQCGIGEIIATPSPS